MRNIGPAQIAVLLIAAIAVVALLAGLAYAITRVVKKAWTKNDQDAA